MADNNVRRVPTSTFLTDLLNLEMQGPGALMCSAIIPFVDANQGAMTGVPSVLTATYDSLQDPASLVGAAISGLACLGPSAPASKSSTADATGLAPAISFTAGDFPSGAAGFAGVPIFGLLLQFGTSNNQPASAVNVNIGWTGLNGGVAMDNATTLQLGGQGTSSFVFLPGSRGQKAYAYTPAMVRVANTAALPVANLTIQGTGAGNALVLPAGTSITAQPLTRGSVGVDDLIKRISVAAWAGAYAVKSALRG